MILLRLNFLLTREKLQRSVQRTLNYRHDIHRGNQRSFEFVNSVKKRFESSLTEDNIDVFLLRAIRDLGDPELAIQYLNYIENSSSKNITLSHRLLVLETAGRAEDKLKKKHWSIISWDVARALKDKLEKLDKNVIIKMEDMSNRGICKSCAVRLKRDKFDPSEIEKLRNAIFDKLERFENFCAKLNKYDVVIDGLNVALTHLPKFEDGSLTKSKVGRKMLLTQSKNILGILTTLSQQGNEKYQKYPKLCHIYTAKRDSQDDRFMMLAALSSGFGTLFVSNDRLRQHNYLLEDSNLQSLFTRWQLTHQCHHKVWVTPDRAQGRNEVPICSYCNV
ncbi:MRPP3 [Lepeophtheirus salmonis]|uniref:MRPP3 n=1 Tax=Lepeophtheirus salmonis TaxID=72036 RepID=A0A7R8CV00_LEPSM|nr:MRPP3 [Lepeophtheirus salmonis]CAF2940977.1 MRPP3 [Lepeophtheirus salmonis]